ncbi:MAG TPA: alkaline phosphatase family protein [Solirubrobacteraceae bacterium]|nr:alkaline phosphatase family protein [Solirubrobacteraceae bacterium]
MGSPDPQLQGLLDRVSAGTNATGRPPGAIAPDAGAGASGRAPGIAPGGGGLRLPPPRVSALLVGVFLAFGVLMGRVAASRVADTPASARSPLKLLLPASGTTAQSGPSASSQSPSPSESPAGETPSSESEATPSATPTNAQTPAKSPSRAGSKSAGSEGGSGSKGGSGSSESAAGTPAKKLPAIKHVFVIMLSDEPYASVFGPSSAAPYLSTTLAHEGELLIGFHAVAHEELADEAALISGQGPTAQTAANCPEYTEIVPTGAGPDEQVLGTGCVYPRSTQTLTKQLEAKRLTWRAYIQGIDEPGAQAGACAHPTVGASDPTAEQTASTGAYATFRNPFVYFGSIVDSLHCEADDVGLASLKGDLATPARTPSFAYIAPDRCDDANPTPCTPGAAAGVARSEAFLKHVVPEITGSKAYKENGLLVITVDEAPSSGAFAESSSCCGQPLFPNDPAKTLIGTPRGGGVVGALLLSPFVKGATTSHEPFNDFSLLRTIEDLFALKHLGYAALPAVKSLEPSLFVNR